MIDKTKIKKLLAEQSKDLHGLLVTILKEEISFADLNFINKVRLKAQRKGFIPKGSVPLKIALIGGHTYFPLNDFIECFLSMENYNVTIFTGDYDNYIQEIIDQKSNLHEFNPDFLFVLPNVFNYLSKLKPSLTFPQLKEMINEEVLKLVELINGCPSNWNTTILNLMPLANRDLGNIRTQVAFDQNGFIQRFNLTLGEEISKISANILDINFLACQYGLKNSNDECFYLETKNIYAHNFLPIVAHEIACSILILKVPPKKVLVLDLDNTLWGGIIGDDGINGIDLGGISPKGEAFVLFQKSIKKLQQRGIILAICSKNEESIALAALSSHPEMILKKEDFISIKINWSPKSENIELIADELNLGLSSFVFVDDNPAEINIVNQYCPEVATILLDMDPAYFANELEDSGFFEPQSITNEDINKSEQYQQEKSRVKLKNKVTNIRDYLNTLEMSAEINLFQEIDLPRISQLINKSNQFNLTTIRRSENEIKSLINNNNHIGLTVKLKDKFGDYGLISVVILKICPNEQLIEIETWVMSCRVLKREVEHFLLNHIVQLAKEKGLSTIKGLYIPTKKNMIVKELYSQLGFDKNSKLEIKDFCPFKTSIRI